MTGKKKTATRRRAARPDESTTLRGAESDAPPATTVDPSLVPSEPFYGPQVGHTTESAPDAPVRDPQPPQEA